MGEFWEFVLLRKFTWPTMSASFAVLMRGAYIVVIRGMPKSVNHLILQYLKGLWSVCNTSFCFLDALYMALCITLNDRRWYDKPLKRFISKLFLEVNSQTWNWFLPRLNVNGHSLVETGNTMVMYETSL